MAKSFRDYAFSGAWGARQAFFQDLVLRLHAEIDFTMYDTIFVTTARPTGLSVRRSDCDRSAGDGVIADGQELRRFAVTGSPVTAVRALLQLAGLPAIGGGYVGDWDPMGSTCPTPVSSGCSRCTAVSSARLIRARSAASAPRPSRSRSNRAGGPAASRRSSCRRARRRQSSSNSAARWARCCSLPARHPRVRGADRSGISALESSRGTGRSSARARLSRSRPMTSSQRSPRVQGVAAASRSRCFPPRRTACRLRVSR